MRLILSRHQIISCTWRFQTCKFVIKLFNRDSGKFSEGTSQIGIIPLMFKSINIFEFGFDFQARAVILQIIKSSHRAACFFTEYFLFLKSAYGLFFFSEIEFRKHLSQSIMDISHLPPSKLYSSPSIIGWPSLFCLISSPSNGISLSLWW